jgi:hypothetical protein
MNRIFKDSRTKVETGQEPEHVLPTFLALESIFVRLNAM